MGEWFSKLGQCPNLLNQSASKLQDNTQPSYCRVPILLVYGRDPNLPLHQLLEPMQHFLGDPDSGKIHLETHSLALALQRKHWMKTDSQPPKRLFPETTPPFKSEIVYTSKTNNQANWSWSGDQDTRLFVLSTTDITSTSKTKLQEKHTPATSRL